MTEFDPAEFGDPPAPPTTSDPRTVAQAKAQAASAAAFFDRVPAQLSEVIATLASLSVTDAEIKTLLEDTTAKIIDPQKLGQFAYAGAKQGVEGSVAPALGQLVTKTAAALKQPIQELQTQLIADTAERKALQQRLAKHETLQRWHKLGYGLCALLTLFVGWQGYHNGNEHGLAVAGDQKAAAAWGNTPNGRIARRLDEADTGALPRFADCSGQGWTRDTKAGLKVCFPGPGVTGWLRPK
jgi:hypothetical protein